MRGRLVGLVLLPLALLVALNLRTTVESRRVVAASGAITDAMPLLRDLVAVRTALLIERADAEAVGRAEQIGLDAGTARLLVGLRAGASRDETDEALAAMDAADHPFALEELADLRADIDRGALVAQQVRARYESLDHHLAAALDRQQLVVGDGIVRASDERLQVTAAAVRQSLDLYRDAAAQASDLAEHWLAEPEVRPLALAALSDSASRYARSAERFEEVTVGLPDLAARWEALEIGMERIDEPVRAALSGDAAPLRDGGAIDLPRLASTFGGVLALSGDMGGLPLEAAEVMEAEAVALARSTRIQNRQTLALTVASLLVLVVSAGWIGRSIARPLSHLTDRAQRVGAGELAGAPLSVDGPRDIALASAAFNDVVANLTLLERKSHALAECDFDHPVLTMPMPGDLGEALQRSVRVLSGSIIEREGLQERLAHQATHDPLTGIANRAAALDVMERALARSRRAGELLALTFIDLDDFKWVNDTFGHAVGDGLLRQVAERMEAAVRVEDVVARLGGDEFVVISERIGSATEATALARRVLDALAQPVDVQGHRLSVEGSAGIALDDDHIDAVSDLLAKADMAVYRAKQRPGSSVIELFDEALNRQLLERAELEAALSSALAAGGEGLELHYQPIVDSETQELSAVEALVRWRRDGRTVFPDEFIPVAEATNLIVELDRWVLHTGLAQLAAWSDQPQLVGVTLAVNVSGRHVVHSGFVADVEGALAASGVDPSRLTIEVTETVLLSDLGKAATQLDAIRRLGVRVAVDDFGTGYTSLAHLRHLPVDEIKIDRSFVDQLPDTHDRNLIQIVNELARHLGVPTVAEGVETAEHASILREIGCDQLQGYLFTRPLPAAGLETWLVDDSVDIA